MVSNFRGRERRARQRVRWLILEALICAVAAWGCSSKTIRADGAGGSKHTASGGKPSDAPTNSTGGESVSESGGSHDPGSDGSSGGSFGSGGVARAGGGNLGAGGLGRASGGDFGAGGSQGAGTGGAGIASGGGAGTHPDAGILPAIDPEIPAVTSECPQFVTGMISFMGLDGIQLAVGTTPMEAKAPMLLYWHGTASNSGEYATMAAPIASGILSAGGVIVSFQGTTGGDLYSGTSIFGVGDLVPADQLVACAVRDAHVDPRRIYTTGCNAGGLFSTAMAALRSSYIAAAAPNSGGQLIALPFQSAHTPALMTVHERMGINGGLIIDFASTSAAADKAFKARGGFVIDCNTGAGTCGGGPLAPDVWQFFLAHPFGVDPEPWIVLPPTFSTLCKIQ